MLHLKLSESQQVSHSTIPLWLFDVEVISQNTPTSTDLYPVYICSGLVFGVISPVNCGTLQTQVCADLNHVQSVAGALQSIPKEISKVIKAKQDEAELQQRGNSGFDF